MPVLSYSYSLLFFYTQATAIPSGRTYPHLLHTHIELCSVYVVAKITGHKAGFADVILNLSLNLHCSAVKLCGSVFVEKG